MASAASSTSTKIEAKLLPPFSRRTPPQDADSSIVASLDRLEKGRVSEMSIVKDQGVLDLRRGKEDPRFQRVRLRLYRDARPAGLHQRPDRCELVYLAQLVDQELKKSEPPVK